VRGEFNAIGDLAKVLRTSEIFEQDALFERAGGEASSPHRKTPHRYSRIAS